jgi:Protein of unknown function DUF262
MVTGPGLDPNSLAAAVERERKQSGVRSLDVSFNELADMHETGELLITPEYQRTFRWSNSKQSQFVESVILEMPLPPIYAIDVGDGRWELIDGLQRLSTYLHFRGQLDAPQRDPVIQRGDFLRLEGCDIIPELNGFAFEDLTTSLQHRARRATLRVEVVRRESNRKFAYYMFKRLNTGGEPLSDQEVRNCSIRLLGRKFNDFIIHLKADDRFQDCIDDVTDEYRARMGEAELVLRFFAFKNNLDEYTHDIDPFLTDYMERVTDEESPDRIVFDYSAEEVLFRRTFAVLAEALGASACRRYVADKPRGGFSMSHFEAFSIGLSRVANEIPLAQAPEVTLKLKAALENAKNDPKLRELTTGGGKNFRRIYAEKIGIVETYAREAL